jgi:UDP-glucose:(heptosyl)LPS alpha-1,3-glucosyltransferase
MLSERGHEVFVFCADGIEIPRVTLIRLSTARFPRWLRALSFALNHKKHVRQFGLDAVLGFGNTLALDVYQSHGGIQRVWMEREIESYDDPNERRLKAFLLKSSINQKIQQRIAEYPIRNHHYSRVVAISDMIKKQMIDYYGINEDKIDVVYNGVDIHRFHPRSIELEGPLKGLSPLLHSLSRLTCSGKPFQLLVMGRGRRKRYQRLIEKLNLSDHVTFLGEKANPETVYQQAHILAHPTFYDACSITTMEAMASGLPVITTQWNGASALISPGEGYVIDEPRNTAALGNALQNLLDDEKRRQMGRAARLKMENYTMERNMREVERILLETAGTRGR